jgi:hypothetical protein
MKISSSRNYILYPAQTNLELCIQMEEMGYTPRDIEVVHDAYMFSIDKIFSMFRGSGKPFINHLVGVASIMVLDKQSVTMIQAALMHALYQNRVEFGKYNNLDEKRELLKTAFGSEVDDLIWRYTQFEMVAIEQINMNDLAQLEEVLILRIADEVEDLTSFGFMFHGRKEDGETVKGSGLYRKGEKMKQSNKIVAITQLLGLPRLQEAVEHWYGFESSPVYSNSIKTGYYSSIALVANNKAG